MSHTGKTVRLNPNDVPNSGIWNRILRTFNMAVVELDEDVAEVEDRRKPAILSEDNIKKKYWPDTSLRSLKVGKTAWVRPSAIRVDSQRQIWVDMDAERQDYEKEYNSYSAYDYTTNYQVKLTERGMVLKNPYLPFDVDLEFDASQAYDKYDPIVEMMSSYNFKEA